MTVMHPAMNEAERVATAIAIFEARAGLTSREFEERYAQGEFRGATWALAWHGLVAPRPAAPEPVALAR